MKKEILERLETEIKACKRYAANSIKKAKERNIGSAINLLDIAQTAKTCADQAHEELWEASQGNLTDEEFELFAEAEILDRELQKTYKELQLARQNKKRAFALFLLVDLKGLFLLEELTWDEKIKKSQAYKVHAGLVPL